MVNPLTADRQSKIYEYIKDHGVVKVSTLPSVFGVSSSTIARELRSLELEGLIEKGHGTAYARSTHSLEPPYFVRSSYYAQQKSLIGKTAARLVQPNDVIFIDAGTTSLEVANHLKENQDLVVLTNSVPAMLSLLKKSGVRIFIIGGMIHRDEMAIINENVKAFLSHFKIDRFFLSASAVSLDKGITDYEIGEVMAKQAALNAAREVILVADHSKFGRVAPTTVGQITVAHKIVTDDGLDSDVLDELRARGIDVIVASSE